MKTKIKQTNKNSFFSQPKKVLIIGYGRMGKLITKILLRKTSARISVLSRNKRATNEKRLCFLNNWQNLPGFDLIIPCVPISAFESCVKQITANIAAPGICLDVNSVKVYPVRVMEKNLPVYIKIIASHPLFGPDSYKINRGLKNLKFVLYNINAPKKDYRSLKLFFKSLGLKIIEISPEKHDWHMTNSLGFSYLIGKINSIFGIKKTPLDTYDFNLLIGHARIVNSDSDQLFLDMQKYNPYAKKSRDRFLKICNQLIAKLNLSCNPKVQC